MRMSEDYERANLKTHDQKKALVDQRDKAMDDHKKKNGNSEEDAVKFARDVVKFWNVVKPFGENQDDQEWSRFAPGHDDNDGLDAMLDEASGVVDYKRLEAHFEKELKHSQREFSREFTAKVSHCKTKCKVAIENCATIIRDKTENEFNIMEDWLEDMGAAFGMLQQTKFYQKQIKRKVLELKK